MTYKINMSYLHLYSFMQNEIAQVSSMATDRGHHIKCRVVTP